MSVSRRPRKAPKEERGSRGWVLHKYGLHENYPQSRMGDRYFEEHNPLKIEKVGHQDCTACTCGVLVPGHILVDSTYAEFRAAEGHLSLEPKMTDSKVCPRCERGLPNDREPGSLRGH